MLRLSPMTSMSMMGTAHKRGRNGRIVSCGCFVNGDNDRWDGSERTVWPSSHNLWSWTGKIHGHAPSLNFIPCINLLPFDVAEAVLLALLFRLCLRVCRREGMFANLVKTCLESVIQKFLSCGSFRTQGTWYMSTSLFPINLALKQMMTNRVLRILFLSVTMYQSIEAAAEAAGSAGFGMQVYVMNVEGAMQVVDVPPDATVGILRSAIGVGAEMTMSISGQALDRDNDFLADIGITAEAVVHLHPSAAPQIPVRIGREDENEWTPLNITASNFQQFITGLRSKSVPVHLKVNVFWPYRTRRNRRRNRVVQIAIEDAYISYLCGPLRLLDALHGWGVDVDGIDEDEVTRQLARLDREQGGPPQMRLLFRIKAPAGRTRVGIFGDNLF